MPIKTSRAEPLPVPGSWGKRALASRGMAPPSPTGHITYQISLLTRVPRWSLGAFPALEGRKMGAEQQSAGSSASPTAPGDKGGHSLAAQLLRWSQPSPYNQ